MRTFRSFRLAAVLIAVLAYPASASAATIAVTTIDDELNADGDCSVREAIQSVNATALQDACLNTGAAFGINDTVNLVPAAIYQLTLTGDGEQLNATGDLDVLKDLTINGNAAMPPAFIGNISDGDRLFEVPSTTTASLTLNSLNLNGGEVTDSGDLPVGGNIRYRGSETLTLDDVLVELGAAGNTGSGVGGGIAADSGAVAIQNGSVIQNNDAVPSVGSTYSGGGIFISGNGTDLTIFNSTVSGNDAGVGGGATQGIGGGIFLAATGASTVTLTTATVSGNNAGGAGVPGFGGGIATDSGATPAITINGGSIINNDAGGGAGATGDGFGGGIYSDGTGTGGPITLDSVDVTGNRAGGVGGEGTGEGGGIASEASVVVEDGSSISSNQAGIDDDVDDVTDPTGEGGGIRMSASGALTITDSVVNANRAGEDAGLGGGVSMESSGNLAVSGSSITNNSVGTAFATGAAIGGGIGRTNASGDPLDSVTESTISGNGISGDGGNTRGGGIGVQTRGTFAITASTVSANTTTGTTGDSVGGGLSLESAASSDAAFTLENSTVSGNNATSSDSGNGGDGGGISTGLLGGTPETLAITQGTVAGNTAEDQAGSPGKGGNLRVGGTGSVDLRGSIISAGIGESGAENCSAAVVGAFDSIGGNVEGPGTSQCGLDQASDRPNMDPLIGGLASNGGPTQTRAITSVSSPAVDLVPAVLCPPPATDQRGTVRPLGGGACDSGAYESAFTAPGPPQSPTLTGTSPASGANDNSPKIVGAAVVGSTVRLYTNPTCTSAIAATGTNAQFASPGLTVSVPDGSTTTFYATAENGNGTSACSASSVTYAEVTPTPPAVTPPAKAPPPAKKCKKKKKKKRSAAAAKKCKKKKKK